MKKKEKIIHFFVGNERKKEREREREGEHFTHREQR
jgi:hypothetical protein